MANGLALGAYKVKQVISNFTENAIRKLIKSNVLILAMKEILCMSKKVNFGWKYRAVKKVRIKLIQLL